MKTTQILLEELRLKLANEQGKTVEKITNYAIAKHLHQTETTVARWAHNKGSFSDETCELFARELNYDVGFVLASIRAEREKNETIKRAWERLATLSMGVTAALLVAFALPFVSADDMQYGLIALSTAPSSGALYIMSNALSENWALILPLFLLMLLAAIPHHHHPKKETVTLSD